MRSFKYRSEETELMDDLDCDGEVVDQTLRELDVINRKLGGNFISIQGLKELVKLAGKQESITLIDLGCGGGDILIFMAKWARKNQVNLKLIGIDANPNIIGYAENHCKDFPEISFQSLDIFSKEFQSLKFDVVHSSLFTHHFSSEELIRLFTALSKQATIGMIINDLHRHWLAFYSIKLITSIFSKSEMVRNDACISVARGFKKSEVKEILEACKFTNYSLKWKWAFRWKVIVDFRKL
ncbi:MAG: methyltransferase domain-containing protein [Bacteroidota bacterium]